MLTVDGEPREFDDPYRAVTDELARYKLAELPDLPPFAGGAVGLFGYDLVRWFEPSVGEPNPDDVGIPDLALMVSDVLRRVRPLHPRGHRAGERVRRTAATSTRATPRRSRAIVDVRERLSAPVPRSRAGRREPPAFDESNLGAGGLRRRRSSAARSTSARATRTRSSRASAGAPSCPSRRSRSTAACARSTRARTCTSSTSRTSRSRARRRRRSSRSAAARRASARSRARARAPRRPRRTCTSPRTCWPTRRSAPST